MVEQFACSSLNAWAAASVDARRHLPLVRWIRHQKSVIMSPLTVYQYGDQQAITNGTTNAWLPRGFSAWQQDVRWDQEYLRHSSSCTSGNRLLSFANLNKLLGGLIFKKVALQRVQLKILCLGIHPPPNSRHCQSCIWAFGCIYPFTSQGSGNRLSQMALKADGSASSSRLLSTKSQAQRTCQV